MNTGIVWSERCGTCHNRWPYWNNGNCIQIFREYLMAVLLCPLHEKSDEADPEKEMGICINDSEGGNGE